jgi:hypothetical protein
MTDHFYSHFCPVQFPPVRGPAWSPDGRFVATEPFGDPADVIVAPADGSSRAKVVAKGFAATWAPDGTHFAYVRDCEVHVHSISGNSLGAETAAVPGFNYGWLPDGNLLVGGSGSGPSDWTIVDREGRLVRAYGSNAIVPLGGAYVLTRESFRTPGVEAGSSSPDSRLTLTDAAGNVVRVIENGSEAVFSPNRRYLVYGVRPPFQPDATVFILDLAAPTSDPAKLTTVRGFDDQTWSPDSRRMAFIQRNEDGTRQLMVLDTKSLDIAKVADNADNPQWFPDSKRLLFTGR